MHANNKINKNQSYSFYHLYLPETVTNEFHKIPRIYEDDPTLILTSTLTKKEKSEPR